MDVGILRSHVTTLSRADDAANGEWHTRRDSGWQWVAVGDRLCSECNYLKWARANELTSRRGVCRQTRCCIGPADGKLGRGVFPLHGRLAAWEVRHGLSLVDG